MAAALTRPDIASPRLAHQPALDGLRAIAVTMVLLFHGKVSWMRGGYFGVSVFFTLSGFLITSLLAREFTASGRIAPRAFYARRLRRLLPASVVCLSAVCVLGAFDVWKGVEHLRRDVLGAVFQVANWVQLLSGESYTELQSKNAGLVSPIDHYWSLAIEEQFYWFWPLAFWALARLARRRGWRLSTVVTVLVMACGLSAPLIASIWGRDAAYWATPARIAEILLGAALALALADGRVEPRRWMAPIGLTAVVVVSVALPAAGGPAYHGAFPLLAVATTVLLLGLQRPGAVTTALSAAPLVALGKVSYGVYLYHFPIFVLMSPSRTGWSGTPLLVAQLVATLAVAVASFWAVERPIRFGVRSGSVTAVWSAAATAAVCAVAFVVPSAGAASYYTPDADLVQEAGIKPVSDDLPLIASPGAAVGAPTTSSPPAVTVATTPDTVEPVTTDRSGPAAEPTASVATTVAPATTTTAVVIPTLNRPARILVVGDSTAEATGAGLVVWAAAHPDVAQVSLAVSPGCGFVRGGVVPTDGDTPFQKNCDHLLDEELPRDLSTLQPDVVMMMVTARDIAPRVWNDADGLLDPSDPRYVAALRHDYQAITDLILSTTAARVVWIRQPTVNPYWMNQPSVLVSPVLQAIRADVVTDTVAANASRSQVLDLRAWMEADGVAADHDARPDGLHFAPGAALYVAETWLGPQLVAAAAENALAQLDSAAPTTTGSG